MAPSFKTTCHGSDGSFEQLWANAISVDLSLVKINHVISHFFPKQCSSQS
jgi:hypothetical protein